MNSHLLPFPYNQAESPPRLISTLVWPLCDVLLREPTRFTPWQPSTIPIPFGTNKTGLPPIRVVCISDTHNATPPLPPGDILIHAGDLTAHGTFDELQAQLWWLSAQPHTHKIVIAGNHDLILDKECDGKFLTRGEEDSVVKQKQLDWGEIRYLHNEAVTLDIERSLSNDSAGGQDAVPRRVKIYGSPLTPEFGRWAFQYPAIRDVWTNAVPEDTDILVVHGPPALYGDYDGEKGPTGKFKVKGDGYLLREIRRVQPRLVICGHIHGAFGISCIELDAVKDVRDAQQMCWGGYGLRRVLKALWSKVTEIHNAHHPRQTLVINAAFAPDGLSSKNKDAITVDLGI
ncbi:Metallo-dependent phosphatase-like protein [Aspergillus granulosus]|uniref:Metallo-dependent phosphatase-like protein n=1 Tax=Aspergillus granulosus TaxID=176169 RepID=A0ABR4HDG3_9EURO